VTARWFRWGSGREEWPGSISGVRGSSPGGCSGVSGVRGSSPGGCSGAGRAGVSCPRRTGSRQSGGSGRQWCSGLGALGGRKAM
jgi:hypothetical protein